MGGAGLSADLPPVPGLRAVSAVDARRHGIASAAGAVWSLRRAPNWPVFRALSFPCRRWLLSVSFTGASAAAAGHRSPCATRCPSHTHESCGRIVSSLPAPRFAHVMSMSSGDLTIHGTQAHYELRLPLYEVPHVTNPAQSLFAHIAFSSAGRPAQLLRSRLPRGCRAGLLFVYGELQVRRASRSLGCGLHASTRSLCRTTCTCCASITAPNTIRPCSTFRFRARRCVSGLLRLWRPPSSQAGGGVLRALGGAAQILFLASLVLAARGRRELLLLAAMFLAGQIAAALDRAATRHGSHPRVSWKPPPA